MLTVAVVLASAVNFFAGESPKAAAGKAGQGNLNLWAGKTAAQWYIDMMDKIVQLSDAQKKSITQVIEARDKAMKEFQTANAAKLQAASKAMLAAYQSKDKEKIAKSQKAYQELYAPIHELMKKSQADLNNLLTAQQRAKQQEHQMSTWLKSLTDPAKLSDEQTQRARAAYAELAKKSDDAALWRKWPEAIQKILALEQKTHIFKHRQTSYIKAAFARANLTPAQWKQIDAAIDAAAKEFKPLLDWSAYQKLSEKVNALLTQEQKAAMKKPWAPAGAGGWTVSSPDRSPAVLARARRGGRPPRRVLAGFGGPTGAGGASQETEPAAGPRACRAGSGAGKPRGQGRIETRNVLLKAGCKPLKNIQDLIDAIQKAKDKDLAIELNRGGKAEKLTVRPAKRTACGLQFGGAGGKVIVLGRAESSRRRPARRRDRHDHEDRQKAGQNQGQAGKDLGGRRNGIGQTSQGFASLRRADVGRRARSHRSGRRRQAGRLPQRKIVIGMGVPGSNFRKRSSARKLTELKKHKFDRIATASNWAARPSHQEESIMKNLLFLSLTILCCAAGAAIANEYHVAQKNLAADDKNPGTADKPLKTINAAVAGARLKPGDTLYVHEGVYREAVELSCGNAYHGQPGAHVRIVAWPKDVVEIKGSNVVGDWKEYDGEAPAAAAAPAASKGKIYVKENWPHNTQQVFCDGKPLTQIAGFVGEGYVQEAWEGRKGKSLADLEPGSFYCDRGAKKLYLWLPGGEDPAKRVVEAQVRSGGIGTCDLNWYDIAGFKVTHASVGMGGSFGAHNTLENIEVAYADFCGIGVGGSFNTVIDCKSNYNGNTGISTYGRGHRVLNCEVRFNNRRRWNAGWHAGGMKNFSSDTVISGCLAEGNVQSPGIWFDGSNTGVTIENCRCSRNGLGIMYEIGERAIIKNNICCENAGRGIYISNSAYCAIVSNLCYRNGMSGIVVIGVEREGGTVGDEETTYTPARNNVVWGNILMDNCCPGLAIKGWEGRPELILPDEKIKSNAGNVSDYNLFYRSGKRGIPFWWNWGAMNCWTLKEWREKTGNDKHSIVAEPLFKDAARCDFHPANKSPAILFARPQMCVATDFDGKQRNDSPLLTAGPYEADPKFLPGSRPAAVSQPSAISFDYVKPLPKELAALSDAMTKELPLCKLPNGKTGFLLKDVPVMNENPPTAATLNKNMRSLRMGISRNAKTMCFALGLANPGKGVQLHCRITRQDGTVVELKWEAGKNIGPSLGPWDGKLSGDDKNAKTERRLAVQGRPGADIPDLLEQRQRVVSAEGHRVDPRRRLGRRADFRRDGEVTGDAPDAAAAAPHVQLPLSLAIGSFGFKLLGCKSIHQHQRIVVLRTRLGGDHFDGQPCRAGRGEDVDSRGLHRRPGPVGMLARGDAAPLLLRDRARLAQPTRTAYEGERLVVARQENLPLQGSRDVAHGFPIGAVQQDRRLVLVEDLAGRLRRGRVRRAGQAPPVFRAAVLTPQPHPSRREHLLRRRNHHRVQRAHLPRFVAEALDVPWGSHVNSSALARSGRIMPAPVRLVEANRRCLPGRDRRLR